jgi:hypothetical protein
MQQARLLQRIGYITPQHESAHSNVTPTIHGIPQTGHVMRIPNLTTVQPSLQTQIGIQYHHSPRLGTEHHGFLLIQQLPTMPQPPLLPVITSVQHDFIMRADAYQIPNLVQLTIEHEVRLGHEHGEPAM